MTNPIDSSPLSPFEKDPLQFNKKEFEAGLDEPSDYTPQKVHDELKTILIDSWTEENIADLVNSQFEDRVRVYKKDRDRIDSKCATIYAFRFLDAASGKHHVLYHSRDADFMRTKILHYFVPFNGPYISSSNEVLKSISRNYFSFAVQDKTDSEGNSVSYDSNNKYQEHVAAIEFPPFVFISYTANMLATDFGFGLMNVKGLDSQDDGESKI
jgi:hypothetical protein